MGGPGTPCPYEGQLGKGQRRLPFLHFYPGVEKVRALKRPMSSIPVDFGFPAGDSSVCPSSFTAPGRYREQAGWIPQTFLNMEVRNG
jgi:hypothetical protein